ncbi:MAG: TrmH family RNA methyltransferase [Clostridia bacterium]|nr:TrmH family RNA methyltransferase [Clostridia bacterium]
MPSLEGYRTDLDYSYAPGIFPSMECLLYRAGEVRRLLVHSSAAGREGVEKLTELARNHRIRVEEADRALARISGKENCYAAAVFSKFEDNLRGDRPHIVLHRPGDSGNVGTILRTALGLGMEDAALIRPCVDVFDPRTVRASMGSLFRMRVRVYDSFEEYRKEFPQRKLYPFMLDASVPLGEVREIPEVYSLVFGNEGSGLPAEFAGMGQAVRIESNDRVDSLNLAIAAGIGIYHFVRTKS